MQKLHLEEAARRRLEVERALAEKQKITTEKGFLQNDLAEGNAQIRNLQRAVKARANTSKATTGKDSENAGPPTTPKKNKSLGHGDGFEDDELQLMSPSKLPYRSKTSTPKAGNKRKRKTVPASPIKPLQLSPAKDRSGTVDLPDEAPVQPTSNTTAAHSPAITAPATAPPDRRFEVCSLIKIRVSVYPAEDWQLSQQVMNHRMNIDGKRTFEALSDFSYPSKANTTLSTIFLDKMSALSVRNDVEHFPVALSLVIISMWKQCVDEKFVPRFPTHLRSRKQLTWRMLVESNPSTLRLNPVHPFH